MDNPIDNILIEWADALCPIFKKTNHTPNIITTYSLIFGLLSIWCLYKGYVWLFGLNYMISYFFDCMDGHYARKYKMTSKGGDMYDHIKDIVVYILIVFIVYIKYKSVIKFSDLLVLLIFLIINFVHLGCQQKQKEKKEDDHHEILDNLQKLCPDENLIYYTRFFGLGTLSIVSIILVIVIHYRYKNILAG